MVIDWSIVFGAIGALASIVMPIILYYLKSVSTTLKELIKPVEKLQKSVGELNIKFATMIADRHNDKDLLDELRIDVKELQKKCLHCREK